MTTPIHTCKPFHADSLNQHYLESQPVIPDSGTEASNVVGKGGQSQQPDRKRQPGPDKDREGRQGAGNQRGQRQKQNRGLTGVSGGDYREGQVTCFQRQGGSYVDLRDCGGVPKDKTDRGQEKSHHIGGPRKSADGVRVSVTADQYSLAKGPLPQSKHVVPNSLPKPSSKSTGVPMYPSGTTYV